VYGTVLYRHEINMKTVLNVAKLVKMSKCNKALDLQWYFEACQFCIDSFCL